MTREEAKAAILASGGKIFGVEFVKRGDGSTRTMSARLGVVSHLRGGDKGYDAESHNLITVFDMHKVAYRNVPVEGLLSVTLDGKKEVVK